MGIGAATKKRALVEGATSHSGHNKRLKKNECGSVVGTRSLLCSTDSPRSNSGRSTVTTVNIVTPTTIISAVQQPNNDRELPPPPNLSKVASIGKLSPLGPSLGSSNITNMTISKCTTSCGGSVACTKGNKIMVAGDPTDADTMSKKSARTATTTTKNNTKTNDSNQTTAQKRSSKTETQWRSVLVLLLVGLVLGSVVFLGRIGHASTGEDLVLTELGVSRGPIESSIKALLTYQPEEEEPSPELAFLPSYSRTAIAADANSPQAQAWEWLHQGDSQYADYDGLPDWRKLQRFALGTIYFANGGGGGSSDLLLLADRSQHECAWFRSHRDDDYRWFCNDNDQVTHLALAGMGLQGELPIELQMLSGLRVLDLRENIMVGGPLPASLGLLPNLVHLQLQGCQFSKADGGGDVIPSSIWQLSKLETLGLSDNHIFGGRPLPSEIGLLSSSLRDIQLENVGIGGVMPTEMNQLVAVERMLLAGNAITEFPGDIFSSLDRLQHLDLRYNRLSDSTAAVLLGRTNEHRQVRL